MMRAARAALSAVVLVGVLLQAGVLAGAQDGPSTDGPTISLDRSSMRPGERVLITLDRFDGTAVTISVCGNQARRGSVDCNVTASEGLGLDRDGTSTLTEFPVAAPPMPCPCLIRASTTNFDEVAVAPIDLIGHPVGPVVGDHPTDRVAVSVSARRAPDGIVASLRAALGGPTAYDVTVTVRNRSAEVLDGLVLAGSAARRSGGDVATLDVAAPGPLAPGQSWTGAARATVPAPVLGSFVWEVTATAAGATVRAEEATRSLPLGFVLLVLVFLGDVGAIAWRRATGRHRRVPLRTAQRVDGALTP